MASCFKILDEILEPSVEAKTVLPDTHIENIFVYALCWSLGALLELDDRVKFTGVIRTINPGIIGALPEGDTIFEYYVTEQGQWQHWDTRVVAWTYPIDYDPKFAELLIPTLDSIRYESLLSLLQPRGKPVLFTGAAGVSKTATMLQYITSLDREKWVLKTTPFSFVTTPEIFQVDPRPQTRNPKP